MEDNKELYFNLQLQKLIEYIKNNQIEVALDFAQNELVPLLEKEENVHKNSIIKKFNLSIEMLFGLFGKSHESSCFSRHFQISFS